MSFLKPITRSFIYLARISILLFAISLCRCSSAPEIRLNDGIVEESMKDITGITTDDVSRVSHKEELSLDDLYILAVERTERLAIKNEAMEQASAQKSKAIAGFLPTLSYVYNKFYSVPGHTPQPTLTENIRKYNAYQSGDATAFLPSSSSYSALPPTVGAGSRLLLSIPLTNGISAYNDYRAAKMLIEERKLEAKHEAGRLYLEIAQGYFNFLQLAESVKSSEESFRLQTEIVKERRRLYSLGRIMRSELLSSETDLSNSEATLTDTKFQLEQVRSALALMVGLKEEVRLADFKVILPPVPMSIDPDGFISKRFDVLSAGKSVKVAEANQDKAKVGFLPNIAVNNYYSFPVHGQARNKDVIVQLAVTVPLTPLSAAADIKMAESASKQAKLQESLIRRTATQEIRNAFESFQNSEKLLRIYEKAFQLAKQTSGSQAANYQSGRSSKIEAILSKLAMINSETIYKRMIHQHTLNRIALGVSIGEIPQIPSEKKGSGE
ncbi:channel protein TolC [Leptospira perolatii]|uniref:Channel protein TolC n=1 Tax=Leptospira perolatii TaxID=2023191 RepID=A0A2M9ZSQ4_9LEPT|nr:TolC family protein [Leptospira perolatii]PJZ68772.1 channel protein TolC [Leptospira perolatii]PJZ75127.1 channel protein TolC [Leptospira perolatii]